MRKASFPQNGYIFKHKTNENAFARELYLAEGESLSDWEEITEAEYEAIQREAEEKARMGMMDYGRN